MNTTSKTQSSRGETIPPASFIPSTGNESAIIGASDKPEDTIIMHDARIITPNPYGVYGLCKIIEHLQNN